MGKAPAADKPVPGQVELENVVCLSNNEQPHMSSPYNDYAVARSGRCLEPPIQLSEGTIAKIARTKKVVLFIGQDSAGIQPDEPDGKPNLKDLAPYHTLEKQIDEVLAKLDQQFPTGWVALFGGDQIFDGGIGNVMFYVKNKGHLTLAYQNWVEDTVYKDVVQGNMDYVEPTPTFFMDENCNYQNGIENIEESGMTDRPIFMLTSAKGSCKKTSKSITENEEKLVGGSREYLNMDDGARISALVAVGTAGYATEDLAYVEARHWEIPVFKIEGVRCLPGKFDREKKKYATDGNSISVDGRQPKCVVDDA